MTTETLNPPFCGFDGFPYMLKPLPGGSAEIRLLPALWPRQKYFEYASEHTDETGVSCYLLLGPGMAYQADIAGMESRPDPAYRRLFLAESRPVPAFVETEEIILRQRYLAAWHAYHFATILPETSHEVTRFLAIAGRAVDENSLLALPEGGAELLRTLSLYADLHRAWRGGWLQKPWRAWMAEVALAARLLTPRGRRAVSRIHSMETSRPGASPDYFGQALERELPDLFRDIEPRVLHETGASSHVA